MNIRNRLNAGLLMAVLMVVLGATAWADDHGNFRAGPLKVVTQNLYVGGDILLPLSVRHEWPHLVGLQEVYVVKICLDPGQIFCPIDQDYLEILLENLNERTESYREVATVTNIDLQNLPAVRRTFPRCCRTAPLYSSASRIAT
jgi:hypothetical protein